jgi:RimJ/RimL family protein N-acetyltransferase
MNPIPFIEGNKIDLIPLSSERVNLYLKWLNRPKIRRYSRNMLPRTVQEWKKFFTDSEKKGLKDFIELDIWYKKDKSLVGSLGLYNIDWYNGFAYIGLLIGEDEYWGKGICTEAIKLLTDYAFKELNLNKLYAQIYAPNKASCRCFEKNHFVRELTLKRDEYIDGEYVDTFLYAMLKDEWMKNVNSICY